jgi:hypothetical protein
MILTTKDTKEHKGMNSYVVSCIFVVFCMKVGFR